MSQMSQSFDSLSPTQQLQMDFDEVLKDFGTFQKMVVYLVLLPAVVPCGFHAYNQVFMSATPDHWCKVSELDNKNLSVEVIKNISIPMKIVNEVKYYAGCVYYDRNYSLLFDAEYTENIKNVDVVPCREGWVYDTSKYISTVVTEWNLVCKDEFSTTLALVLFGVGGAIGNFVFGYAQDLLGRKIAFFLYLTIETIFGIGSAFATSFPFWVFLRFGVGFTVPAILGSPLVLSVELVGPKDRAYCTILINIAYSLGLVVLSGIFYAVRDWRQLTLVTTLPFIFFFAYWWVMPESPRWLYAKGRFQECAEVLNKMAAVNQTDFPIDYINNFKEKCKDEKKTIEDNRNNYGVMDLFRTPNLRKKTILITLIWFTNTAVYVGLSYYAPALGTDEFLSFFLAGVVELPTYIFLWQAMERVGRRWTLCLSMVIGGLACLATFLTESRQTVTLLLYCLGKMGISCSFVVLPLTASELYPTVVRGVGMSFSSVVGQIGPIFIPLVNYLGEEWMVLPLIIMGGLLVFGGGLSLILPETLHQNLPETIQEAEAFGKESFDCWPFKRTKSIEGEKETKIEEKKEEKEGKEEKMENRKFEQSDTFQLESKTLQTV